MPRRSTTGNVRKICGCTKWKTCSHPWYLDFQHNGVRCNKRQLSKLIGREPTDYFDAQAEAFRAIKALREGRDPRGLVPDDQPTVAELLDAFLRDHPRSDVKQAQWQLGPIVRIALRSPSGPRPFGTWRLGMVTRDVLEEFRHARPKVAGSRDLALLRAAFNYGVLKGLVATTPFRVGNVPAVPIRETAPRSRRLHDGEEAGLLAHGRTIGPLITAALETGMRKGELLSLQWHQVRFTPRAEIFLPAQKTKAKKDRRVPISSVLRQLLDTRRHDPAGDLLPPEAYVFGDEIGRRRGDIDRAWEVAVLKAHGHKPVWSHPKKGSRSSKLAPTSRALLRDIDLHFHDLRREAGSRWMDAGVPLASIQRWLGHHNIWQTSTYLGASIGGDEQDMQAFEARVGRHQEAPDVPFPQNSHSRTQDHPKPTRPDLGPSKTPNKNRVRPQPTPTVH